MAALNISQPKLPAFETQSHPDTWPQLQPPVLALAVSSGAACVTSSSTRRFSLHKSAPRQDILIKYFVNIYTQDSLHLHKARVTRACDICSRVTACSYLKFCLPPPASSIYIISSAGPGSVPQHVMCCALTYHSLSYQDQGPPSLATTASLC